MEVRVSSKAEARIFHIADLSPFTVEMWVGREERRSENDGFIN